MANTKIRMQTTKGDMLIELFDEAAPETCKNFVRYVEDGFFDGTLFHRVIPGFVIQGGGFASGMHQKQTHAPIQNEANNGEKNLKYTLSMARTNDPHSATSQFFINLNNNTNLDHTAPNPYGWGYAVYGKVTEGTEVVDAIAQVQTGNHGMHQDVPLDEVSITSATVEA